ncbi:MAG TPA: TetR family transcriptional regulator [Microthrixaceae bacterium]|nr:TetR family transcriptional regulator [Microthrixaceae bacterium]
MRKERGAISEQQQDRASSGGSTLTRSQQARRDRMLRVAAELAQEGGWDAVQMREVAQRAEVALGTLYRYFPSKEFLLVSVMIHEIQALADRLAIRPPEGDDPVERVVDVLRRANKALQRQPQVTVAMIRALVSGNQEIAPAVRETRALMRRIISDALGVEHPQLEGGSTNGTAAAGTNGPVTREVQMIDLLSDVWLAALVSWITGVEPASALVPKLSEATRTLLG